MPRTIEGQLIDSGGRHALVVSRFNGFITEKLLEGALHTLGRHGVDLESRVDVVWVPGAWELPLVAQKLARSGGYASIIALGCVIRGGTAHFEYVAGQAASGLAAVARETGVPVIFGVLTTESIEQAIDRAGAKMGNKGAEAALSAIEMCSLLAAIDGKS